MRPIIVSLTLVAGSANGIALSQALGAAGALTLNGAAVSGGVATLSPARRVIVHSAGNDSGITWTVVGTDRQGAALTETFAGANVGDAQSTQDFLTVTSITGSAASAGIVTAGTSNVASSSWIPLDRYQTDAIVGVACNVLSGTPTYDLEWTYDNVFGQLPSGVSFPRAVAWANMVGLTGDANNKLTDPIVACRVTLKAAGSVQITVIQQGPGG